MVTLVHGDDLLSSRNFFVDKKAKENGILLSGKDILIQDLIQTTEGQSLFTNAKNIFLEDFFSKRKPDNDFKKIVDYLKLNEEKINLTIWESKEISKTKISLFKKPIVKIFKLPQSLFLFLDSLRPNNSMNLIKLFHECLKTSEQEFLLYMMIRQSRLLLSISYNQAADLIDETKRLAPWQKSKLTKQASYFSKEQLIRLHNSLFEMDLASKTGNFPLSLVDSIDFFLLEI